jgi:CBS domain-containing protein
MSTRIVTFRPETNVVEAMRAFLDHNISGAPVVSEDGRVVGMLSEVDLMKVVIQDSYYDESAGIVGDFMKSPVDTISPNDDIYTVAGRFLAEGRRRYPVVDDGRLVGQVSRSDVLRAAEDFLQRR